MNRPASGEPAAVASGELGRAESARPEPEGIESGVPTALQAQDWPDDALEPVDTHGEPAPPADLDEASLEALLFVAERPLSRREIAGLAGVSRAEVDARLGDLEVALRARGIRLVLSGDRVELASAPEAGRLIGRYLGVGALRLSPAALETLAIVAYRQPVTRSAVEQIRGVDSDYTLRTLLHRRLVVELARSDAPGRPILYGTGFEFLERFGLVSLDELPALDAELAERLVEQAPAAVDGDGPGPDG
jgi:segregation and condensation protein B